MTIYEDDDNIIHVHFNIIILYKSLIGHCVGVLIATVSHPLLDVYVLQEQSLMTLDPPLFNTSIA